MTKMKEVQTYLAKYMLKLSENGKTKLNQFNTSKYYEFDDLEKTVDCCMYMHIGISHVL